MPRSIFAFAITISLILSATVVFADFYQYKDGRGTVHMTNKLDSVPQKYRERMKVIREDKPAPATSEQNSPAEEAAQKAQAPAQTVDAQPTTRFGQMTARYPWLKPLIIIGALLVGFLLVAKLGDAIPSPHLAKLLYMCFFLGVFIFAYKAYADHLVSSYFTVKERVITMFKKANEREELRPEENPAGQSDPRAELKELKKE